MFTGKMNNKALISIVGVIAGAYFVITNGQYRTIALIIVIALSVYFGKCYDKEGKVIKGEASGKPLPPPNQIQLPDEWQQEQKRVPLPY